MNEIWKDIPGYEGKYQVSSIGRVRSLRLIKVTCNILRQTPLVLKPHIMGRRIYYQYFKLCRLGKRECRSGHSLVLEAFVGPRPPGLCCAHYDGDPLNNSISNLRWATQKENAQDKDRHGHVLRGEQHPNAKMTDNNVRELRRLRSELKMTWTSLGKKYGISRIVATDIGRRKRWQHI